MPADHNKKDITAHCTTAVQFESDATMFKGDL